MYHREQKFSTAVAKEGGKNPVWNEEFVFEITTEKEISIDVRTHKQESPHWHLALCLCLSVPLCV